MDETISPLSQPYNAQETEAQKGEVTKITQLLNGETRQSDSWAFVLIYIPQAPYSYLYKCVCVSSM